MRQDLIDNRTQARLLVATVRPTVLSAAIAFALAAALQPGDVRAQAAAAPARTAALEEVIVTARKREESLQETPVTIQAFSGDKLVDNGVLRPTDLQFAVPGFYVQSYESRASVTMRGVGAQVSGALSAVAMHVNGIYQSSAAAQLNRLFDVERVEVVKGPQGTLYGRNSTAGAINVITKGPGQELEGDATLSYGTYDMVRFEGGASIPLSDTWGMRVAASYAKSDGKLTNVFNGQKVGEEDFLGGRLTLAGDVGAVRTELFVQYAEDDTNTTLLLIPVINDPHTPRLGWDKTSYDRPTDPVLARKPLLAGLTLSGDINDSYSWRAITGYLDYEDGAKTDVNPVPPTVPPAPPRPTLTQAFPQEATQFSQELQLLYSSERMNWVLGAFYLDDEQSESRFLDFNEAVVFMDSTSVDETKAYAIYGDLNYNLTDALRLNVGARYNYEDKRNAYVGNYPAPIGFDGTSFDESFTQDEPTWRLGLDYTFRPGLMVYGSVSTGYQAGYYTVKVDPTTETELPSEVKPEDITAFEVGLKSILPGERGFFNAAAFYYDYKDMQVLVGGIFLLPDGSPDPDRPPFYFYDNAAKAEIYGLDVELSELRVAEHLKFDFVAEYLHATYKDYQSFDDFGQLVSFDGNTLPRAPEFMLSSAMTIDNLRFGSTAEGQLRIEYNYRGKTYFTNENTEVASQESLGLVNAFAIVDLGNQWSVRAGGRNLTDEKFFDFYDGRAFGVPGEFRTWEVGVNLRFQ